MKSIIFPKIDIHIDTLIFFFLTISKRNAFTEIYVTSGEFPKKELTGIEKAYSK